MGFDLPAIVNTLCDPSKLESLGTKKNRFLDAVDKQLGEGGPGTAEVQVALYALQQQDLSGFPGAKKIATKYSRHARKVQPLELRRPHTLREPRRRTTVAPPTLAPDDARVAREHTSSLVDSVPSDPLSSQPEELIFGILGLLDVQSLGRTMCVSRLHSRIAKDPELWRSHLPPEERSRDRSVQTSTARGSVRAGRAAERRDWERPGKLGGIPRALRKLADRTGFDNTLRKSRTMQIHAASPTERTAMIRDLRQAAKIGGKKHYIHEKLAVLLVQEGRDDEALQHLDAAERLRPPPSSDRELARQISITGMRGAVLMRMGDIAGGHQAMATLDAMVAGVRDLKIHIAADNERMRLLEIALDPALTGHEQLARYRLMMDSDPTLASETALFTLRMLYVRGGAPDGEFAKAVIADTLRLHPKELKIHYLAAMVLRDIGDTDEARSILEKALRLNVGQASTEYRKFRADIHRNLAEIEAAAGNRELADRHTALSFVHDASARPAAIWGSPESHGRTYIIADLYLSAVASFGRGQHVQAFNAATKAIRMCTEKDLEHVGPVRQLERQLVLERAEAAHAILRSSRGKPKAFKTLMNALHDAAEAFPEDEDLGGYLKEAQEQHS